MFPRVSGARRPTAFKWGGGQVSLQDIQTTSSATVAIDAGASTASRERACLSRALSATLGVRWIRTIYPSAHPGRRPANQPEQRGLPKRVRSGPCPLHHLSSQGDLSLYNTGFSNLRFGAEYWYRRQIALRVGYRFAPYGDLSGVTGLASGVGLCFDNWEFAYALTTQGDMGTTSQVSLSNYF